MFSLACAGATLISFCIWTKSLSWQWIFFSHLFCVIFLSENRRCPCLGDLIAYKSSTQCVTRLSYWYKVVSSWFPRLATLQVAHCCSFRTFPHHSAVYQSDNAFQLLSVPLVAGRRNGRHRQGMGTSEIQEGKRNEIFNDKWSMTLTDPHLLTPRPLSFSLPLYFFFLGWEGKIRFFLAPVKMCRNAVMTVR